MSATPSRPVFSPLTWLPLGAIATTLFVTFAVNVLLGGLPPRLLDPLWQLRVVSLLIDNASLALVGLGLVHLQAYLEPDDSPSHLWRDHIARLAVAAALGFLLLVPLQIMASVQLLQTSGVVDARRAAAITADHATLRREILAATSSQDLQARLQRLRRLGAPLIGPTDRAAPLEPLRQKLLAGLSRARADALRQLASASRPRLWSLFTTVARNLVCALAFAAGFAAGARNRSSPVPLLVECASLLLRDRVRVVSPRPPGAAGRVQVVDEEYFEAIVDSEPETGEPQTGVSELGEPPSGQPERR